jgi:hypothetical protein
MRYARNATMKAVSQILQAIQVDTKFLLPSIIFLFRFS